MNYHNCEFIQVEQETYNYYYGTKGNHGAWVSIKKTETGKWYYLRLGVHKSDEFNTLQECIDIAYTDMMRAKV